MFSGYRIYLCPVLLACALLLSSCVGQAPDDSLYSDIFFVNNTHQPLSIQVQQTGDALLLAGEHYFVYENSVPAFTTQRILRINRQLPIAANQEIYFSTRVENDNVSLELNQTVLSLVSDSALSFGGTVDDSALPFQVDTQIHRTAFAQSDGLIAEFAFRRKKKGLYSDIDYVLTESYQPAVLDSSPDKLSVLTYNVWALPFVSNQIAERLNVMPEYLAQYDVLLLQEAFSSDRENLIRTLEEDYGYRYVTKILNNPEPNIFNGGVILLSRYPIVNQAQTYFPDCAGSDCLADKGINYMEIIKQGRSYHIFSAHTASFDTDIARLYRQNQFEQMREFTESLEIPKNETVIYGGDFNVNKLLFPEDYQQMLATLEASEPTYTGHTESTFDPFINVHGTAFGSGGDHIEYLDYVLVSNQYAVPNANVNNVRIPRSTTQSLWGLWDLSDHFPVEAFIE